MSPTLRGKHAGTIRRLRVQIEPRLPEGLAPYEMSSVAIPEDPHDYATPDLTVLPVQWDEDDSWLTDPRDVVADRHRGSPTLRILISAPVAACLGVGSSVGRCVGAGLWAGYGVVPSADWDRAADRFDRDRRPAECGVQDRGDARQRLVPDRDDDTETRPSRRRSRTAATARAQSPMADRLAADRP